LEDQHKFDCGKDKTRKRKSSKNNSLRKKKEKHRHIKEIKSKNWVSFARMPFVSRVEMLQRAKKPLNE
jgi:hypothetical protein